MKHLFATILLCNCLYTIVNAQISDSTIAFYAKLLSQRNAHMIGSDSMAPHLELIYTRFIKSVVQYKSGSRSHTSMMQLQGNYRRIENDIYKLLDKRSRRLYIRLVKCTGNILLLKRNAE